jgi:DNA-binding LacI/PurR family transcriptional regulator
MKVGFGGCSACVPPSSLLKKNVYIASSSGIMGIEFCRILLNVMRNTLLNDQSLAQRPRLQEACVLLHDMAQRLEANAKLPTMVELRSELGISVQTLNDAVRELEKRNILRSVRGTGIYVAQQHQRLVTGNIGFASSHNMHPAQDIAFWGMVLAGMRQAAGERNCQLLLIDNGSTFNRWEKVDGVVLCNTLDPRDPYRPLPSLPRNFPCISIFNEIGDAPCIAVDDFSGAYQLTSHLVALGHRRIAYLATANAGLSQLEQRKQGYLKALRDAGLEPNRHYMRELHKRSEWEGLPTWYPQAGQYYMQRWLEEDWDELGCTAVVAQNDDTAEGVIAALQQAGFEVPRDISVTGFDGLPVANGTPRLTTAQMPLLEVGRQAVTGLLDWLIDPSRVPQNMQLPAPLIVGQTTSPPGSDALPKSAYEEKLLAEH